MTETLRSQCRGPGFHGWGTSSPVPELRVLMSQLKILHATTKTRYSQINLKNR